MSSARRDDAGLAKASLRRIDAVDRHNLMKPAGQNEKGPSDCVAPPQSSLATDSSSRLA